MFSLFLGVIAGSTGAASGAREAGTGVAGARSGDTGDGLSWRQQW